jgi:hypothetical protein
MTMVNFPLPLQIGVFLFKEIQSIEITWFAIATYPCDPRDKPGLANLDDAALNMVVLLCDDEYHISFLHT